MKKQTLSIITLLVLAVAVGMAPATVYAAPAPATLTIISPHPDTIKTEYGAAFNTYYQSLTGQPVDMKWIDVGGTTNDVNYIQSNFAATPNGIGIDLFFGGGVDPFVALADQGLLAPYKVEKPANLTEIPPTLGGIPVYDSKYRWYGVFLSGFGIIYNKQLLKQMGLPEPKTWEDLTNPKLKGWVASADLTSGSTHMCYEIMLQGYGWEKGFRLATLIGANVKSFLSGSGLVPTAVSAGDAVCGLAIDYYAWAQISQVGADKIGYALPTGLTTINADSIAILKGAPDMDVAKTFVSWVLSRPAQKIAMQRVGSVGGPTKVAVGRMCVIPALYTTIPAADNIVPVNPFQVTAQLPYNATKGSIRYSFVNDLLTSTMVDTHEKLSDSWAQIIGTNKTLVDAGLSTTKIGQAIDALTKVPISEKDGLNASLYWSNQAVRNKYITLWHNSARQSYDDASNQAIAAASLALSSTIQTINSLKVDAQNNLYYGLVGGVVLGIVLGIVIMAFVGRRREAAAVK